MKAFPSKDDPATNERHYHITQKQYKEETHNINNADTTKTYNNTNNRYTDEHYYSKAMCK